MITNTVDAPQVYYLYQSPRFKYPGYTMVVVINNLWYIVYYRGSSILCDTRTVTKVLEDWETLDISLTVTIARPDEMPGFMKFTSVDVLQDYIKSLMCFEVL